MHHVYVFNVLTVCPLTIIRFFAKKMGWPNYTSSKTQLLYNVFRTYLRYRSQAGGRVTSHCLRMLNIVFQMTYLTTKSSETRQKVL